MNPRVSKVGRSFKGLNSYLSHDKDKAQTSDRLGEVWLFNLPISATGDGVSDSERAANIMAFTAKNWESIQKIHHQNLLEAGQVKGAYCRPPRPPEKPVYSYSLRFHPDDKDKVTPALLEEAINGSREAVGMSDLQAIAYEHTDFEVTDEFPEHPSHVHVVINRIDPLTGLSRSYSKDQYKLSRFAEEFGAKHGLKPVEQRIENNARRAQGEIVYDKSLPRSDYERFKAYRGKDEIRIRKERLTQQDADLTQLNSRLSARRSVFEKQLDDSFSSSKAYFEQQLSEAERTIKLDHLGAVFKVFTRLKQRFTGELKRERLRKSKLEHSLKQIENQKLIQRREFEKACAEEMIKLKAVHTAQRERDEEYFKYRRTRRRTETAGEAGRKSFNAKRVAKSTPQPWLKAQILREQKAASNIEALQDIQMGLPQNTNEKLTGDDIDRELKKWSRKEGRGANKTEGRKRNRTRSQKRTQKPV